MSRLFGAKDGLSYCGERQFKIIGSDHEDYLSYDEALKILTLDSVNDADITTGRSVTIEASLVDYEDVKTQTNFNIIITSCETTSITASITPE